jgi:endoglucanase
MDKLLNDLIHAHGVSGSEEDVREIIMHAIKDHVTGMQIDKMGNLLAIRKGTKPMVMLAAHMDEIGLVSKSISETGRIYFSPVGGIDPLTLIGQRVHLKHGKDGRDVLHGIITTEELVDGNDIYDKTRFSDMFIDTGLGKADLLKKGVNVGIFIDLEQDCGVLGKDNIIYGKSLDDRLGCYILLEVARRLKGKNCEIAFVFTVQEEIGLYGAVTSAYELNPDWAIVVDVVNTYEAKGLRKLGAGPCLTIKDSLMITNKNLNRWITDIAKKKNIPLQNDVSDLGTTDALNISISKGGVPVTVLGVAVKNIHSTAGIADLNDVECAIELLVHLLENPIKKA